MNDRNFNQNATAEAALNKSSEAAASSAGGRVYVIDDDPEVLNVVTAMLTLSGYDVKAYNSPSDFLVDSVSLPAGVVVTDQVMHQVEGIEVQRRLSSRPNHFKVILVTAFPRTSLAVTAMKYGAVTVLDKPFKRTELLLAVVEAFRQLQQTDSFNSTLPPVLPSGGSYLDRLSQREKDVILLVYRGDTNKSIGIQLGISFKTVEKHRSSAMKKLQVTSIASLVQLIDRDLGKS